MVSVGFSQRMLIVCRGRTSEERLQIGRLKGRGSKVSKSASALEIEVGLPGKTFFHSVHTILDLPYIRNHGRC